ncbi:MAG: bifunctional hydroxymethylpyrimidine kinase/phosphomethylpyrimidine kinase [Promethearchaeota archaeon]|nr:MAG: bifunctional hydroxymethylpyrimidine kinase/phosphomethylpyrimidine kinase [Candidatus Lokiarchaeota archaeon]
MKKALTIAGSDSGGGAGIQADLKTFISRGVYGMSVITALTSQNTMGVQGIFEIEADFVGKQIDSIMTDIGADIWKIGMLGNEDIIRMVSNKVKQYNIQNLVLDPVMVAKSGDPLLRNEAQDALISQLIPLAYVITPNIFEAEVLSRMNINNIEDMHNAAKKIISLGVKYVIIKGGPFINEKFAIDLLYDGKNLIEYKSENLKTKNTHGSGCTFASAIAAELAKKYGIEKAVHIAKAYLTTLIKNSQNFNIGQGRGPLNHYLGQSLAIDLNIVEIVKKY